MNANTSLEEARLQDPDPVCRVVTVGLPRSGSSLVSRLLNESPDLCVIDDLYYLQLVDQLGAAEHANPEQARTLGQMLKRKVRQRLSRRDEPEFKRTLVLTEAQIAAIDAAVDDEVEDGTTWQALLQRFMSALARAEGKSGWGYNTPQDYLHLDQVTTAFPDAKVLFVLRSPFAVLQSYKNLGFRSSDRTKVSDDERRYNPLIQATHWKLCASTYLDWSERLGDRITLLRYEDLVENPLSTIETLGQKLGIDLPRVDLRSLGSNSSYRGQEVRPLTETERWATRMMLRKSVAKLGYELEPARPRVGDLPEVLTILQRSGWYYTTATLRSSDMRARLKRGFRAATKRETK